MKSLLFALISGFLLALGWPTYGFPLLLFFGFVPLLMATRSIRLSGAKRKGLSVFGLAYLTFFIFNICTTWWLYYSTAFGMWFAVLANALLMAIVWQLYYFVSKKQSFKVSLIFLLCIWMLFEKLHLSWEFSWPWLNLGNAFATYTGWIQWYEYTGTFGGTLWIWLGNFIIFSAVLKYQIYKERPILIRAGIQFALLLFIPIVISQFILRSYDEKIDPVDVVILQPNIDPYTEKYNTTNERIADLLFSQASEVLTQKTDFLIAPETVLAEGFGVDLRNFRYTPERIKAMDFLSKYPHLNYLAGIQFYRLYHDENNIIPTSNFLGKDRMGEPIWGDFFNSAILLNSKDTSQIYHKSKLVVGVENFPYQSFLKPLLGDVMLDLGGTVAMKTKQENRSIFEGTDSTAVAPIICYESVYGEFVTGYVQNGAQFLAVITNDAWWQDTQGHKQHLNYARLRAIETRRSIARSANTGISAIINQKGEIEKQLGYGIQGTISGSLNKNEEVTFYVKYGDFLARMAIFPAIFIFLFALVPYKREKK